jgi:hypothetical protein
MVTVQPWHLEQDSDSGGLGVDALMDENARLRVHVERLEVRVRKDEARRRALLHIMSDLNETNKRLADQRKAMLHILVDYEQDRRRLARQTKRLDNSRKPSCGSSWRCCSSMRNSPPWAPCWPAWPMSCTIRSPS